MKRFVPSCLAALALLTGEAQAQSSYPIKPVKIVVPVAAGGAVDTMARLYGAHMSKVTGRQFFVENKPGGGNVLGIESVVQSPADGHTILFVASAITLNQFAHKKLPYDVERDLIPVTQVVSMANVLVTHPSLPVTTLAQYIALAKARPGQINYASSGVGGVLHMSMELLKYMAKIDVLHVPYRGLGPGMQDLLAGHVGSMMANAFAARPHISSGKLRGLGVTSRERTLALPDIPTFSEAAVKGYEVLNWFGIFVPTGTSQAIVDRLHAEAAAMLFAPETKQRLASEGADPVASKPAEFKAFVKSELEKWAAVAKAANLQAN